MNAVQALTDGRLSAMQHIHVGVHVDRLVFVYGHARRNQYPVPITSGGHEPYRLDVDLRAAGEQKNVNITVCRTHQHLDGIHVGNRTGVGNIKLM